MNISSIEELERRKSVREIEIPQPMKNINIKSLMELCDEYLEYYKDPHYRMNNDYRVSIYEKALTTIYGREVFKWIEKVKAENF